MREHELRRNPLSRGEVLMVATSCSRLTGSDEETGLWLSELAVPYCEFRKKGYDVTIASPMGGQIPVDPKSIKFAPLQAENELTQRDLECFNADETAQQSMSHSVPLDQVDNISMYRVVFLAGGHGASFDFPSTHKLQALVKEAFEKGILVAAICHGNAVFATEDMGKLLRGRRLTSFTDEEERAVGRDGDVPFLLESRLRELGIDVVPGPPGESHVIVDGNLLTGQNPPSAAKLAEEVLLALDRTNPAGPSSHPGTLTAEEVPEALHIDPILPSSQGVHAAHDNLGPNADPNPGTNVGNDAPAAG